MKKEIYTILAKQEEREYSVYQSIQSVKKMMHADFENSNDVIEMLNSFQQKERELFFNGTTRLDWPQGFVPVRKCEYFNASKHTLCQISYTHSHNFYELIYVLSGKCDQYIETSHRLIHLNVHEGCILKPGIMHRMERSSSDDVVIKFSISCELFDKAVLPLMDMGFENDIIIFKYYNANIDFYISMLIKEYVQKRHFYKLAVKNYLTLLFVELLRGPYEQYSDVLFQLNAYFEENQNKITLQGFAKEMGYNEDYTGKLIKRSTGKNFKELVLDLKLDKAAKMLRETEDPIALIAEKLGYSNPSGLYRQFHRANGMTPSEYRKFYL